ncbi:MAG: fructose-6-phosphate aldolase [Planctomycetes bacterium]|nr:fructose-6-phosphate aldolase [Planctomycetota bacterium]
MKFFLDTAIIEEIREANSYGILDGVTTNPSLVAKTGKTFYKVLEEICEEVKGPVSAEVTAIESPKMVQEGKTLAKLAPNIVVKVPLIKEGIKAAKILEEDGIRCNVTLCFSAMQALLAAKVGAAYISPFIGRLDDLNQDGMELIGEIRQIYDNYGYKTEILAASIRHPLHAKQAALLGADVATMPFGPMMQLFNHPLTDLGLDRFLKDWEKVPK